MKCPFCSSKKTKVVDKRSVQGNSMNWRRRECLNCERRFTTYESFDAAKLFVVKKNGSKSPFDKNKIVESIIKSRGKKRLTLERIEGVVDDIERTLLAKNVEDVSSKEVGALVLEHLKRVDPVAYIRYASVFKEFETVDSFEKELSNLKVKKSISKVNDSTDLYMQVSSSSEEINDWDKSKITKALMEETGLSEWQADEIAVGVEKKLLSSKLSQVSVSLIRELVNNELLLNGYTELLESQKILGMPIYNLKQLIFSKTNENSNIRSNNPEAVNLAIAENALKQFALSSVFSKDVANAHLTGALHLHDLGFITRVYCSAHSPEYIKKYGLRDLLTLSTTAKPAKYASVLTGHILTFLASMQPYYAGALGLSHINVFYAPLLVGKSYKQMVQEAQNLIFGVAQGAFSRGGQTMFIDFNVHLGIPNYMKDVPAIGANGEYTGKTYSEYEEITQQFAKAMLEVWKQGDSEGKVFTFPKCDLHINQEAFDDLKQKEILKFACDVASNNGSPYFIFDRDEVTLSACCRLKTKVEDTYVLKHPESLRFCGFQNVTINLPQAAYKSGKNVDMCIKEIGKAMDLAVRAHLEKKSFIRQLMSSKFNPLWQIGKLAQDGRPYIDLEKSTYILGLIGLNECVKFLTGEELHDSDDAYKLGLKIVSSMYLRLKDYEKKYKLHFTLEESPAEGASLRFAKVDLKRYPEAKEFVRGNLENGEVYYTNSIHFVPDAPISIFERIEKQGRFNNIIESGSITHVFVGEQMPDADAVFSLVKKTWENTQSAQLTISPEFTVCRDCKKVSSGYKRGG